MKNKFIVPALVVMIVLLAANTYRLQRELDKQRTISEQQIKLADSLQASFELKQVEAQMTLNQTQVILARVQKDVDSARKAHQKN